MIIFEKVGTMTKAEELKEILQSIIHQTEKAEIASSEEVINKLIQQLQS